MKSCNFLKILSLLLIGLVCGVSFAEDKARYEKHVVKMKTGDREFYVYIPATLKKDQKAPAVITFHGFKSDANGMRWLINSDKIADKYGFIMVYPNALNKSWNVGKGSGTVPSKTDDISFASAMVDVVKARFPVDPERIYAMGFSNGAQMVSAMACRVSGKIAAGGMVAHTMNIDPCEPDHKVPIALIHGAKDPFAKFSGGGVGNIGSWKESVSFFRQIHELKGEGQVFIEKPTARCRNWLGEQKKPMVVGCVAFDGGHNWPGGMEFEEKTFGKLNKDINATEVLFSFFSKHKGKPKTRDRANKVVMKYPARPAQKTAKKDAQGEKKQVDAKQDQQKQKKQDNKPAVVAVPGVKLEWREQVEGKEKYKFAFTKPSILPQEVTTRLVAVLGPQAVSADALAGMLNIKEYAAPWRVVHVFFAFDPWQKPTRDAARVLASMERVADELNLIAPEMSVVAWSDGGRIAEELYCNHKVPLTAMAIIGYGWRGEDCESPVTLPLMLVHSKQDKRHLYGGDEKKNVQPFKTLVAKKQEQLGGGFTRESLKAGKDHRCDRYQDMHQTTELSVCTVDWGGNTIPGVKAAFPKEFGKVMGNLNVVPMVYSFLGRYRHHGFTAIHNR